MTANNDNYLCPICREYLLEPRIYECGHSICEQCMKKSDETLESNNKNLFQATTYKCAMCRNETLIKWFNRPINHRLIDILSTNEEYVSSLEEYRKNKKDIPPETPTIPDNVNMASIVNSKRQEKCNQLYEEIVPLLFEASLVGKPYITITHHVKDIQCVADMLAKKLFNNHGIYKLQTTQNECQIDIIPSNRSFQCEYVNRSYSRQLNANRNSDSDEEEEEEENENEETKLEIDLRPVVAQLSNELIGSVTRSRFSSR